MANGGSGRNKVLYAPKNERYCVSVLMGAHEGMYWRMTADGGAVAEFRTGQAICSFNREHSVLLNVEKRASV